MFYFELKVNNNYNNNYYKTQYIKLKKINKNSP